MAQILARLSLSLPGAVIFAYLTSEATAARRLEVWAVQVAVQLQSVSAYVERLEPDTRLEILRQLGLKVFVGPATTMDKRRETTATDGTTSDLAGQVVELIRSVPLPTPGPSGTRNQGAPT